MVFSSIREPSTRVAAGAALAVTAVGLLVLLGWQLDVQWLKGGYGSITMKTNTAIAFVCCGLSLWLTTLRRQRNAVVLLATLALLISALTLSQHLVGWDLGIDQLLFTEAPGAVATTSPNRMGPHGSASIVLAALALLLLVLNSERAIRSAQALAMCGAASALVPVTGYLYDARELYGVARYTGIALPTAVTLLVLHVGVLATRAQSGPIAVFTADSSAGTLLRRLTLPIVLLPITLGLVYVRGREAEIIDRGLGMSLFAVATIVILFLVVWGTTAAIDLSDRGRREAYVAAERANRLKDQFIAVLSHELRTPLNVMLGRLRALEQDVDPATRVRYAAVIVRNGQLLARLVEDLLDWSRATQGQFEIAPVAVDLNAMVRAAVDAIAPEASRRHISITTELGDIARLVHADPLRMQQVLSNLLSNAVKFTPADGAIGVRTGRDEGHVTVSVSDTGVGFDPAFEPYLFEPFRQADQSERRRHGGLGLGLSIARHLVTLHGGTITATSPGAGRGATFTVRLPIVSAASESERDTVAFSSEPTLLTSD